MNLLKLNFLSFLLVSFSQASFADFAKIGTKCELLTESREVCLAEELALLNYDDGSEAVLVELNKRLELCKKSFQSSCHGKIQRIHDTEVNYFLSCQQVSELPQICNDQKSMQCWESFRQKCDILSSESDYKMAMRRLLGFHLN